MVFALLCIALYGSVFVPVQSRGQGSELVIVKETVTSVSSCREPPNFS